MKKPSIYLFLFIVSLSIAGCATTPAINTEGVDLGLMPKRAVAESETLQGKSVLWGGVIINSTNLKDSTQFEMLAYPLDTNQRPITSDNALGRFLAIQPGYLETTDYTQGRQMTIKGVLAGTRTGRVGESEYVYPLVNIKQLHLWEKEAEYVEPRVRFGIGVMIRN